MTYAATIEFVPEAEASYERRKLTEAWADTLAVQQELRDVVVERDALAGHLHRALQYLREFGQPRLAAQLREQASIDSEAFGELK